MPKPTNLLSVFEQHKRRIALDTLKMSEMGAMIAGGPSLEEAVKILKKEYGYTNVILHNKLTRYGHHPKDIERLLSY